MTTNIGSIQAFETLVDQPDAIVAVDFWAPWCGPCRNFAPAFDEASNTVGDAAKFVKVNVDDHQEIAQKHDISSIPTVLYFRGGKVVDRVSGIEPAGKVVERVQKLIGETAA